jgi:predicted dehydrogenase
MESAGDCPNRRGTDNARIEFTNRRPIEEKENNMNNNKNTSQQSRRGFMKAASIVSAGIAVGGVVTAPPAVHAAGSDVIKVGLIGCGGRGMGSLVDRIKVGDAIKIVALCDANRERAVKGMNDLSKMEDAKDKVDLSPDRVFGGFDGHKHVTDLADLVLIGSPPGFHVVHYLHAVEKGKHVFIEKPFCIDAEGYRRCMKANNIAEEKGLTVCSGFQRRHENRYREWISHIHAGEIGDVLSSRIYWNGEGAKERGKWAEGETELCFQAHCWYVFNWLSGDHIVEQHCHNIDVGNWIHGKGDPLAHPVSCVGHGGRQVRKTPKFAFHECGNIFDHHYVEYRYADGSVMHSMCRHMPGCWVKVGETVVGTKGRGEPHWLQPTGGQRWTYRNQEDKNGYQQEHVNQSEAMRNGENLHDGWFAATSSMVGVMGWMATYSGKEIQWDDAVTKGRTLFPYDKELTFDTVPPVTIGPDKTYEHAVAVPGVYDPFDKTEQGETT